MALTKIPGSLIEASGNLTITDLTVTGDLSITGDLNSYNVTDLDVVDQTITLGAGQTEALSGGSGIIIDGSNASILWDETNDEWDFNKAVNVTGTVNGLNLAAGSIATSTSQNFAINTPNSLRINIDSNNSATDQIFVIGHNQTAVDNNNSLMTILESGNVGIGTSSPSGNLHVVGASGNAGRIYLSDADNGTAATDSLLITKSGTGASIYNRDSGNLNLGTNNDNDMVVINSSGNVGIGTSSPSAKCHLYTSTSDAINLGIQNSQRYWKIETVSEKLSIADVSAGGLARMTFDTSGNVGIGTTSPDSNLHVSGTGNRNIKITAGADSSASLRLVNDAHDWDINCQTNDNFAIYSHTDSTERLIINPSTGITLKPNNGTIIVDGGTADYEPAKVELQGRAFGGDITAKYEVSDGGAVFFGSTTNHDIRFIQNNTERMRINSSGLVRVVANSTGTGLCINHTDVRISLNQTNYGKYRISAAHVSGGTAHLGRKAADGYSTNALIAEYWGVEESWAKGAIAYKRVSSYDQGEFQWWLNATASGAEVSSADSRMILTRTGALSINGSLTQNASDERMKDNITLIPNALEKVKQLRGVSFTWREIENSPHEAGTEDIGVIAQDVEAVLPLIVKPAPFDIKVNTTNEGDEETKETVEVVSKSGENYKTVEYEKLVPLLIESIKELEARLTELEG